MQRLVLLGVAGALVLGGCSTDSDDGADGEIDLAPATSEAAEGSGAGVEATATFTVTYEGETATFDFVQSATVPSTLSGPETNPVQLHAGPPADPLREFVLTGRVERGEEIRTSDTTVLALNLEVGRQSITLSSTDGGCRVLVQDLTEGERIAGSFTCDTTYGDQRLRAEGSFAAS